MMNLFTKKGVTGWTSVVAEADGLYGVTIMPSPSPGGKPRVIKSGSVPGGRLDLGSLSQLSRQILVPGCPWTLSLGRDAYHMLVVPEPAVQASELEQSVRWSISTMVDRSVEDGCLAFFKIPTKEHLPNRSPNLYVAFAKNKTIAECNTVFQQAGISLQAIDVRETAQRNIAALAETSGKGLGLLLIGKQGAQFTITFNGVLYLDRFIEEPSLDNATGDAGAVQQTYERVMLQVQRSLDFVERNLAFIKVDRILVVSMPGQLVSAESASQQLHLPVEAFDLASVFDFSSAPELAAKESQPPYFSALGAALRFREPGQQINLHLKPVKTGFVAVQREVAVLGLVFLSLLSVWVVRQNDVVTARKAETASASQLQEAKARLQAKMPQVAADTGIEIAALKAQAAAAQKILAQAVSLGSQEGYARHFSALASIAEKDLWLTSVAIDKSGKSVRLTGRALNKESVLRYAQQLNVLFAGDGVQFTALEMASESVVGRQPDGKPQLASIVFKLY